jgi:branched-chain amino acid transport system substrate-binding protein
MTTNRRNVVKTIGAAGILGLAMRRRAFAQDTGPIRLGFISSLTGAQAPLGQPMLLGAQIAVDDINQAGGVAGRKLELVIRDDKAKPADATVASRELSSDGVNLQFGIVSSSVALALTAMLDQQKAILITCAAHSDRLTKEAFVRNYFRVTDNPYMRERFMAAVMAERYPEVTTWSGVIPDHEYGRTTWNCFEEGILEYYPTIAKKAANVTQAIKSQYGATDYRSVVAGMMGLPAEGFFMSPYGGDAVTLFKQAQPYGFFKKAKVVIDSSNEFIVARAMKQELPEMWVGSHWYAGAFENVETNRKLLAEYTKRTKDRFPDGFVGEGHAAVMAYAKAVQEAGTTATDAVIAALENITFDTSCGPRRFRKEDHQAIKPIILYKIRGSKTAPEGFEVVEYVTKPGEEFMDPPTPGKPLEFKHIKR